jgi:hypothetical protein
MSLQSQVLRAPNEKFYALWRGQPICLMGGVLYYFETEREARAFLGQRTNPLSREGGVEAGAFLAVAVSG